MAQTDAAVVYPALGYVWTGVVGTATKPTTTQLATFVSAGTVPSGWTALGHTDLDNVLTFGSEGGDTSVKGSWQNPALREITTSTLVEYFDVNSLQLLDKTILSLYHGGGSAATTNEFATPDAATTTEKATTLVMVDGTSAVALYCPKASIKKAGDMTFAADDFVKIPLRFTPLKYSTNPKSIWISAGFGDV
jgi:hypothetical protein